MTNPDTAPVALIWPPAELVWRLRQRIELQGALGLALWFALVFVIVRAGNG
jgi:hypothetical protein